MPQSASLKLAGILVQSDALFAQSERPDRVAHDDKVASCEPDTCGSAPSIDFALKSGCNSASTKGRQLCASSEGP